MHDTNRDRSAALQQVQAAAARGDLSPAAAGNIRRWLTEPHFRQYAAEVARQIADGQWQRLNDVFFTVIPFGTGGRRGEMYPIGCNAINDRTIGESAQGLADYVRRQRGSGELSCAIAYDTRHNSRRFAELCAGIMVAAGFRVRFLDDYRSTPELSFLVRHRGCDCGIMVTASHNPPSDNAVKVYWSTGCQVLPPHDQAIIACVEAVEEIRQVDFAEAVRDGRIEVCTSATDEAFVQAVVAQRRPGPRALRVLYSPLHGVGSSAVCPVLRADGFTDLEVFAPHREPDGDFPNVPGHSSNPEHPEVFRDLISRAREIEADLVLATDPDCDRMGCAAPRSLAAAADWTIFTGNQLGVLLADFTLETTAELTSDHYVVKTLVTTEMIRRIADAYGVRTLGNLLVGFKWIGGVIDEQGSERFVFGAEESHGYLAGSHARDKDGALACMLMAELAASLKSRGKSLCEKLEDLYWQHGYHEERLVSVRMRGAEGMARMKSLMRSFRERTPASLGGVPVAQVRDYGQLLIHRPGSTPQPLDGPRGELLILDLAEPGNYVAVRPSGTEPKVKFYAFGFVPPEQLSSLDAARASIAERIDRIAAELAALAESAR